MITSLSVNNGGLGRFGNQLFTIASTIGIAIKNNQPFAFPEWINRDNALFGGNEDKMVDYFVNPLPYLWDHVTPDSFSRFFTDIPYHWEYQEYNLSNQQSYNICSHLQDERYFKHCLPLIRHYFRMKDEPEQNDYVAIHYRAGDYIDDPQAYHPRCSVAYYEKAMRQFPEGASFICFSDNPEEAVDRVEWFDNPVTFIDGDSYIHDFKLMKRCKHFITANSSFSLMAAILGEHPEKKIICPERWFGKQANGLKFEYPEGAIIL